VAQQSVAGHGASTPGVGRLIVTRSGGRSLVHGAYATSPLRLLTPGNHGRAAWIFTSSYGGGLVDGDRIRLDVEVGEGAGAFLSTQASTKVYRSPRGTESTMAASVAAEGLLVVVPDPVVCFSRARYRQEQRFDLAESATLVAVDWLSSGRRAFGERWMFDEYEARLVVRKAGRLLVHDAMALRARDGGLAERLGRFEVLAVVTVVGATLRGEIATITSTIDARPLASAPRRRVHRAHCRNVGRARAQDDSRSGVVPAGVARRRPVCAQMVRARETCI
jgi:urease accessory protein